MFSQLMKNRLLKAKGIKIKEVKIPNFHKGNFSYTDTVLFIKIIFPHINFYQKRCQVKISFYREIAEELLMHSQLSEHVVI